jgi:hypothetical protein
MVRRPPILCLASPNDFIQRKIQLLINNSERPLGASHRRRDDPLRGINAATHPNAEQALSFRSCEGQRSCLPNYSFIMNRVRISPKRNPYIA